MQALDPQLYPIETLIPVCAGDLPSYSFTVSPHELLESVVRVMEQRPELPGMIVAGRRTGVISRAKMFERLGHQYGVELFLRKPVAKLELSLKSTALIVPAQTRIEETVRMALARPHGEIYDPVLIKDAEQTGLRLVDMHDLLLAQSRILANVSNTVGQLEELEKVINSNKTAEEIMLAALELLSHVVPYHQAAVLMQRADRLEYVARRGIGWEGAQASSYANSIHNSQIYRMMRERREAICIPDVNTVADWQHFSDIGNLRSWLGVPLGSSAHFDGLLSLGRLTHSPFSITEKDTAQVFASRIVQSLESKKKPAWRTDRLVEQPLAY
jgi:hypothetical protein